MFRESSCWCSARALNLPRSEFCFACFNGDYPVSVQMEFDKLTFESREPVKA